MTASSSSSNMHPIRNEHHDNIDDKILDLRKEFYKQVLEPHEGQQAVAWMLVVLARRKYHHGLCRGHLCLGREVLRAEKMNEAAFLCTLDLLEYKAKAATDSQGNHIPPQATAFYISVNKLDETRAFYKHLEGMVQTVSERGISAHRNSTKNHKNSSSDQPAAASTPDVMSNYKSCLVKCPVRDYVKLDVDTKEDDKLLKLETLLQEECNLQTKHVVVVETRGGYHILLPIGSNMGALYKFAKSLKQKEGNQQQQQATWLTIEEPSQSPLMVIPGTHQSDWLVRPSTREW